MGSVGFNSSNINTTKMKTFFALSMIVAGVSSAPQLLSRGIGGIGSIGGVGRIGGIGSVGGVVGTGVVSTPVVSTPVVSSHISPVVGHVGVAPVAYQPQPYSYSYAVDDPTYGSQFDASETSDGAGNKQGNYNVALPDGRIQHVTYTTNDVDGYIADVTYDGTASFGGGVGIRPAYHAPVVSTPVVSTPIVSTPVVSTPVVSHAVHSTPVISSGVVSSGLGVGHLG